MSKITNIGASSTLAAPLRLLHDWKELRVDEDRNHGKRTAAQPV